MTLTISLPMVLYASEPMSQLAHHPSNNMLAAAHNDKPTFEQVHCCISNTCFTQILYMMHCGACNGRITWLRCAKFKNFISEHTALAEKRSSTILHQQH